MPASNRLSSLPTLLETKENRQTFDEREIADGSSDKEASNEELPEHTQARNDSRRPSVTASMSKTPSAR